ILLQEKSIGTGAQHDPALQTQPAAQSGQSSCCPQLPVAFPQWPLQVNCFDCGFQPHSCGLNAPHVSAGMHYSLLAHSTHSPCLAQTLLSAHFAPSGSGSCVGSPSLHPSCVHGSSPTGTSMSSASSRTPPLPSQTFRLQSPSCC